MGMNPRGRSRGRNHSNYNNNNNNNNNNRRFNNNGISRNSVFDSSGPAGRLRGTAFQLMEKYLMAAKDAMSSDRVLAENCLQHADHYMRLNAMAVASENRFNAQNQPQPVVEASPAETVPVVEMPENDSVPVEETRAPVQKTFVKPRPVSVFVKPAEPVEELHKIAQMDLSVPVAIMTENEQKPRRGRPPAVQSVSAEGAEPAPKRRGRPPAKKETDV